jgi:hypothetical protein
MTDRVKKDQIDTEVSSIIEIADGLSEKQLLASIIFELRKIRRAFKERINSLNNEIADL